MELHQNNGWALVNNLSFFLHVDGLVKSSQIRIRPYNCRICFLTEKWKADWFLTTIGLNHKLWVPSIFQRRVISCWESLVIFCMLDSHLFGIRRRNFYALNIWLRQRILKRLRSSSLDNAYRNFLVPNHTSSIVLFIRRHSPQGRNHAWASGSWLKRCIR